MPYYNFRCEDCDHIFEEKRTYEDMMTPTLNACPKCQVLGKVIYSPAFSGLADPIKLGHVRPPAAFMEGVVGRMQKKVPHADALTQARFQPSRHV